MLPFLSITHFAHRMGSHQGGSGKRNAQEANAGKTKTHKVDQDLTHALRKDNFLDHLIEAAEGLELTAVRS